MTMFPNIRDKLMRPFLYQQKMIAGDNIAIDKTNEGPEISSDQDALWEALGGKQDTLIAGDNITIVDNVISASGGSPQPPGPGPEYQVLNLSLSSPLCLSSLFWHAIAPTENVTVIANQYSVYSGMELSDQNLMALDLGSADDEAVGLFFGTEEFTPSGSEYLPAGAYYSRFAAVKFDVQFYANAEITDEDDQPVELDAMPAITTPVEFDFRAIDKKTSPYTMTTYISNKVTAPAKITFADYNGTYKMVLESKFTYVAPIWFAKADYDAHAIDKGSIQIQGFGTNAFQFETVAFH